MSRTKPPLSKLDLSICVLNEKNVGSVLSPSIVVSPTDGKEEISDKISRRKLSLKGNKNKESPLRMRLAVANLAKGYEGLTVPRNHVAHQDDGKHYLDSGERGCRSSDELSSDWESCHDHDNMLRRGSDTAPQFTLPTSPERPMARAKLGISPSWRKVKNLVKWTPFIQGPLCSNHHSDGCLACNQPDRKNEDYENVCKRYYWAQLGGHSGNFKPGFSPGTILKKSIVVEEENYRKLMEDDELKTFVPKFHRIVTMLDEDNEEEKFIEMEDCMASFDPDSTCIMDLKMGIRTYQEDELVKALTNPKLRKDMYDKMIAVNPCEPTDEEHFKKGVTKCRYMIWRETISSTSTLGFRIEGIRRDGKSSRDFKNTATKEQVKDQFIKFLADNPLATSQYRSYLEIIKRSLQSSQYFSTHELIGTSLLFVHDKNKAKIWLIDFGKTMPAPTSSKLNHKSPWEVGNHEDGYLVGIEKILGILSELI